MIRSSFVFLPGIGKKKEAGIWRQGIRSWDDFIRKTRVQGISRARKAYYNRLIERARRELYAGNSSFFSGKLSSAESWRLYDFFRDECVYLDIEVTGVSRQDEIVMVGLYDGIDTKIMIRGINLGYRELQKELARYKLLVTFNGASFDLPFLYRKEPLLVPPIPHVDLRHVCRKVGLSGGLKTVEHSLGITRNSMIRSFNGGDALTLWRMYRATGDSYYLDLLVEYNEDDVISLKQIMEHASRKLRAVYSNIR